MSVDDFDLTANGLLGSELLGKFCACQISYLTLEINPLPIYQH